MVCDIMPGPSGEKNIFYICFERIMIINPGSACQMVMVEFDFDTDKMKDNQPTHLISHQ